MLGNCSTILATPSRGSTCQNCTVNVSTVLKNPENIKMIKAQMSGRSESSARNATTQTTASGIGGACCDLSATSHVRRRDQLPCRIRRRLSVLFAASANVVVPSFSPKSVSEFTQQPIKLLFSLSQGEPVICQPLKKLPDCLPGFLSHARPHSRISDVSKLRAPFTPVCQLNEVKLSKCQHEKGSVEAQRASNVVSCELQETKPDTQSQLPRPLATMKRGSCRAATRSANSRANATRTQPPPKN